MLSFESERRGSQTSESMTGLRFAKEGIVTKLKEIISKIEKKAAKSSDKPKQAPWKLVLKIVGILAGVFVLIAVTFGVGIYKLSWNNAPTKFVANIIPYPSATVNGKFISWSEYQNWYSAISHFYTEQKQQAPTDLKGKILDQLIENELISAKAKEQKITVSKSDIDSEYNKTAEASGGQEELAKNIKKLYNWSVAEFKENVIKNQLLRKKLEEKLASSDSWLSSGQNQAKAKAQEVLAKAKAGEDFSKLAQSQSQDTATASTGGDLGYISRGQMVKEFEDAAFGLGAGQVSEIVKTVYGYHIIKVTDIKGDQRKVSHILIKTESFQDWLEKERKAAKVRKFL